MESVFILMGSVFILIGSPVGRGSTYNSDSCMISCVFIVKLA